MNKPCCTAAVLQRRGQRCAARGVTSTRRVPGPPLAAAHSTPASGGAVSLQLQLTNAHASSHGSERTLQLASSPCGCGAHPSEPVRRTRAASICSVGSGCTSAHPCHQLLAQLRAYRSKHLPPPAARAPCVAGAHLVGDQRCFERQQRSLVHVESARAGERRRDQRGARQQRQAYRTRRPWRHCQACATVTGALPSRVRLGSGTRVAPPRLAQHGASRGCRTACGASVQMQESGRIRL